MNHKTASKWPPKQLKTHIDTPLIYCISSCCRRIAFFWLKYNFLIGSTPRCDTLQSTHLIAEVHYVNRSSAISFESNQSIKYIISLESALKSFYHLWSFGFDKCIGHWLCFNVIDNQKDVPNCEAHKYIQIGRVCRKKLTYHFVSISESINGLKCLQNSNKI